LELAVRAAHERTRRTYGAQRLQRELASDGFAVSLGTLKRVRRELGLRCVQRRRRFRVATTDLVVRALAQAVSARRPAAGLIHHSDRGSQYCSHEYRGVLARHRMRASMSRRGNCYDNAPAESFWGTLKTELAHHRRYQTRAEAEREVTEYIDLFYNRRRRQARPGYLSPAAYTQQFMRQRQAA